MAISRIKIVLLGSCVTVFWTGAASAQIAQPTAPAPTTAAESGSAASGQRDPANTAQRPENAGIADIVVTATRRSESIQRVPQQVTALTGDNLSQIVAHTLGDFAGYVPGLSTVSSGPTSLIAIRGVTTGSQLSTTVGLYVDEVPIGASTPFGLGGFSFNANVFDLDRVEVLNGPQGTLFGANSLGGTLRYITAAPNTRGFSAEGEAELSSTDHGGLNYGVRAAVNVPISEWAAFRLTGLEELTSGYVDDPDHGRKNQGRFRTHAIRGSLLLKPADNLDIRLTGLFQRVPSDGGDTVFINPTTNRPIQGKYDQSYPTEQPAVSSLALVSGVINLQMPWAKLSSITSYQSSYGRSNTDQSLVYDAVFAAYGTGGDPWTLYVNADTRKFNQELRLASNTGHFLDWIIGGYFDTERTAETVNLYDLANPGGTFFGIAPFLDTLKSTYREEAVYANGTLNFTSKLSLGFGIRYSNQHQTYYQISSGLLATGSSAQVRAPTARTNQSVETYSINPRYQVTSNFLLYARAASGFRPGGPNFALAPGLGSTSFAPDKLWNYEVGAKATLFDKKATVSFDLYDIEWSKIQLTVNVGGVNQLTNGGNARVRGAEGAFGYRIASALTIGGSASYTDGKLTSPSPVVGVTTGGARLPFSSKYNFSLNGTYSFNLGSDYPGSITVTDRYLSERNVGFGTAVSPNYRLPGFNTVDVYLSVHTPYHVELGVFARNVTNTYGRVGAYTTPLIYNPASAIPIGISQPRTVGAVLKFSY